MSFARSQAHNRPIPGAVATVGVDVRRSFVRRTYTHLAFAILAFTAVCYLFYDTGVYAKMVTLIFGSGAGGMGWLLALGAFMFVSWVADKWARSDTSSTMQYIGLGVYIVAEALIFGPLLFIAAVYSDPSVIPNAAMLTLFLFAGLTGTVFITKKDFSFLRGALVVGGFVAMGLIVVSLIAGFSLGLIFAGAMILYAGMAILYQTSQVMAHYRPTQHVAASLALFAAVALMFYYILMFLMSLTSSD